jgi:hypothetical protein
MAATEPVIGCQQECEGLKCPLPLAKVPPTSRADEIKEMARRRIAEAEAAIAAAEASALQSLQHERFAPKRMPPWVLPADIQQDCNKGAVVSASRGVGQKEQDSKREAAARRFQEYKKHFRTVVNMTGLALSSEKQPTTDIAIVRGMPHSVSFEKGSRVPAQPLQGQAQKAKADGSATVAVKQLPPWAKQRELPSFAAAQSGAYLGIHQNGLPYVELSILSHCFALFHCVLMTLILIGHASQAK